MDYIEISVPADNDGYILLQCPNCGDYFKILTEDYEDDGVFSIFCPSCGLSGDSFITEDVIELARNIAENYVSDIISKQLKDLERKTKNSIISFKVKRTPKRKNENPIYSTIDSLNIVNFPCCKKSAKVKPIIIMSGSYCPFCGVKHYEYK